MSAAFKTTMDVARKMKPAGSAPEAETTPDATAPPVNIDLLTALNEVGVPGLVSRSKLTSHRAGIAPLLSALSEVVSNRGDGGYESLQSDERFWALVELIHEHGEKALASAEAEPSPPSEGSG